MNKNRKEKVKLKLKKIREKKIQDQKYMRETNRLQRMINKLSNKSKRLFNPSHLPGNFVRAFTSLAEGTVVRYEYMGSVRYANIMKDNVMLVLHESEVTNFTECKFKNCQIKAKKGVDISNTEVIMV